MYKILILFFQYMQQQSQIFVFSTALANKGAEAVRSGQFPTIIAYHCAQPETKKFLQVIFYLVAILLNFKGNENL
jgi:hypothetical protein